MPIPLLDPQKYGEGIRVNLRSGPAIQKSRSCPAAGNPQLGNLETPINASGLSKWWINIQPAYRQV